MAATVLARLLSIRIPCAAPLAASGGQWRPYSFPNSLELSVILLIVGVGLLFLGTRLKKAIGVPHRGEQLKVVVVVIWALSIEALLLVYRGRTVRFDGGIQNGPIFPITIASAACTFAYLAYISRHDGFLAAVGNGVVGAAAGPMAFEFAFDWIVIPQVDAPPRYIVAFFVPLLIGVMTTLSLLLLCKCVSVTRYAVYSLGAMLIVFAAWALAGFSYQSKPAPFVLNAIAKVLSFVTVAALFSLNRKGPAILDRKAPGAATNQP